MIDFVFIPAYALKETAQRLALPAGGRDKITLESRRNSEPEKYL